MKKLLFTCALSLNFLFCFSQNEVKFTVEVNTDSILLGNHFEVSFTLENGKGTDFRAPQFEGFNIVGGPNQSSSFSMVNGDVTQSQSYSFYLEPKDIGNYYIEPASIEVDGQIIETAPVEIIAVPNPDGIKQTPKSNRKNESLFREFDFGFPTPPEPPTPPAMKKKKRKTYKL